MDTNVKYLGLSLNTYGYKKKLTSAKGGILK